ncbi:carboxypeptidase M32 [soil metagenome]
MSGLDSLKTAYGEIADIGRAAAVLSWDQQTYMPPRGAESRGRQLATLSGVLHEKITSPALGDLLEKAAAEKNLGADGEAYIRELRIARDRSVKLPAELVKALALEESRTFEVWQRAKQAKDFRLYAPQLAKLVELVRQKAECFGYAETPWDALAQDYERGTSASMVRGFFDPLRIATVDLLDKIRGKEQPADGFLQQKWNLDRQKEFGLRVLRDIGFDMYGGRQDVAPHPFCTTFGVGDVRITTRYKEDSVTDGLSSTIHEMGHALYEMGFPASDDRGPLADAPSLGIHESQSRFWEVRIGQSRAFWEHYLPIASQYFPGQFDGVSVEQIYRAVNRIEPGFIRVEADEISYNLHIIIRFELEVKILSGELAVADIRDAWNQSYRDYLGLTPPDDAKGCLQDVHWAYGSFGYFPSYTFGNIYSAMIVERMQKDLPQMWQGAARGEYREILAWLRDRIHRHGRRLEAVPLIEQATGEKASPDAIIRHLRAKYGEIYSL